MLKESFHKNLDLTLEKRAIGEVSLPSEENRMVLDDSMSWEEIAWAMGREGSGRQSLRNRWRRHVLYGDRSRMGTVLMSTREVAVVLRTLDSTQTRRAPGRGA